MDSKTLPIFLLGIILFIGLTKTTTADDDNKTWWKKANYYQIYPKSFQDSDGDGIGDINGITERLGYLEEIGITATWLSPIFESPMVDNGYDISNFTKIDETFGTEDDFKKMVEKAHKCGIKIILDFVPNHSSDKHEWFKKSIDNDPQYKDYYVWHNGIQNKEDPKKMDPPNNWRSVFKGSAWTWNDKRQQYYLHQFYKQQPDLNFRNEKVKEEMKKVLKYWLDLGVDGFRIDAVPHIIEDIDYRDEPRNPHVNDPEDYMYVLHDYTYDQNETFDIIYDWREVLDKYTEGKDTPDRIILAEAYSPMETKMKYYGNGTRKGAQFPFNFLLLELDEKSTADDYIGKVNEWMTKMPQHETANWVFGNHDKPRIADRLGRDRTTLANLFILSLPGITVTYYGEEIGMQNIELKPKPFYMEDDRNGERSPMQWNNETSAGFSTNEKTWVPVAPDYKTRNVMVQRQIILSHINQYKTMAGIRKKFEFHKADTFKIQKIGNSTINISRTDSRIEILFNVGIEKEILTDNKFNGLQVLYINERSLRRPGNIIKSGDFSLYPNEVVILQPKPSNV